MGESTENGVSSSANSGDSSLLDFDIKSDFLNSWKPKSGGGDANLVDIDFGSPVKNSKKPFGFGKMDMDFNLDSDFGKLSSFNMDMPDLDVSSPLKKDGKNKEKSKDTSGKENKKGKADSFDFSFDFMEMDSFNFKSPAKKNKTRMAGEDKNDSPKGDHQGATIQLTEEKDGLEVGLSEKVTAPVNLSSLNTSSPHGFIDSDSTKEDITHQSITKENVPSDNLTADNVAAASGDRDHDSTNVSMKSVRYDDGTLKTPAAQNVATSSGVLRTSNSNTQLAGLDPKSTKENASLVPSGNDNSTTKLQESTMKKTQVSTIQQTDGQTDKASHGGPIIQEVGSSDTLLEHSDHSTPGEESGEHTRLLQEDTLASNTILGGEQDDSENVTGDSGSRNRELVLEKSSQHISNAESQHAIEGHDVNNNMECPEQVQINSALKRPPEITMSRGRINDDPTRNFPMPSTSRGKVDCAIPASEALITRSKYFTGSSKAAAVLPKSTSSSAPKLTSFVSNSLPNAKSNITTEQKTATSISSPPIPSCIADQAERSTSTTFASAKSLPPTSPIVQQAERSTTSASAKPALPTSTIAQQAGRSTSTTSAFAKPALPNSTIAQQAGRSTLTTSAPVKPVLPTSTIAQQAGRSTSTTSAPAKSLLPTFTIPQQAGRSTSTASASAKSLFPTSTVALQVERSTSTTSASAKPSLLTSTMAQQSERSFSTTSANAKPSLPNLIPLTKNTTLEPEKVATTKTVRRLTDLSGIDTRRNSGTVDSSMNQKEDRSMGSMGNKRLIGNMASKISPLATPSQQTLESLKRKNPEAPPVETSVNHSNSSIKTRRLLETSGISIGKELNMQNLGSSYSLKDDNYIEKAEASSKELEDIRNMLRKKHEEAKDLLVRAIINNNKLLMLNHPLYEEKIRMIQKFAAGLTLGQ